ncbi:hypothetical protein WA158_001845 [Blastocystis sp. Blastoise]
MAEDSVNNYFISYKNDSSSVDYVFQTTQHFDTFSSFKTQALKVIHDLPVDIEVPNAKRVATQIQSNGLNDTRFYYVSDKQKFVPSKQICLEVIPESAKKATKRMNSNEDLSHPQKKQRTEESATSTTTPGISSKSILADLPSSPITTIPATITIGIPKKNVENVTKPSTLKAKPATTTATTTSKNTKKTPSVSTATPTATSVPAATKINAPKVNKKAAKKGNKSDIIPSEQETTKEIVKEVPKDTIKETPKETIQENSKEITKDVVNKDVVNKDIVNKDIVNKDITKETIKENSTSTPSKRGPKTTKKNAKTTTNDISKETTKHPHKTIAKELPKPISKEESKEIQEEEKKVESPKPAAKRGRKPKVVTTTTTTTTTTPVSESKIEGTEVSTSSTSTPATVPTKKSPRINKKSTIKATSKITLEDSDDSDEDIPISISNIKETKPKTRGRPAKTTKVSPTKKNSDKEKVTPVSAVENTTVESSTVENTTVENTTPAPIENTTAAPVENTTAASTTPASVENTGATKKRTNKKQKKQEVSVEKEKVQEAIAPAVVAPVLSHPMPIIEEKKAPTFDMDSASDEDESISTLSQSLDIDSQLTQEISPVEEHSKESSSTNDIKKMDIIEEEKQSKIDIPVENIPKKIDSNVTLSPSSSTTSDSSDSTDDDRIFKDFNLQKTPVKSASPLPISAPVTPSTGTNKQTTISTTAVTTTTNSKANVKNQKKSTTPVKKSTTTNNSDSTTSDTDSDSTSSSSSSSSSDEETLDMILSKRKSISVNPLANLLGKLDKKQITPARVTPKLVSTPSNKSNGPAKVFQKVYTNGEIDNPVEVPSPRPPEDEEKKQTKSARKNKKDLK